MFSKQMENQGEYQIQPSVKYQSNMRIHFQFKLNHKKLSFSVCWQRSLLCAFSFCTFCLRYFEISLRLCILQLSSAVHFEPGKSSASCKFWLAPWYK